MEGPLRSEIVPYLRRAADGAIEEDDFYVYFTAWHRSNTDDLSELVFYEIEHFWGQYHARNIFLIPVKPDKHQLAAARERLRILATALEENWEAQKAEQVISEY